MLTVCDPTSEPEVLLEHLVDDLDFLSFDVLIPDATHEDAHPSIAPYYVRLFDLWLDEYADRGVRIRILDGMIRALAGQWSCIESIGFGPVGAATVCTDGAVEVQDVCRIAGSGSTASPVNVLTHEIDAIQRDELGVRSGARRSTSRRCAGSVRGRWRAAAGISRRGGRPRAASTTRARIATTCR